MLSGRSSSKLSTASTTILLKNFLCWWINFEFKAVAAHSIKVLRVSSGVAFLILTLSWSIFSVANWIAFLNALMMILEWTPSSMKGFTCFKNSAARRTTLVVPSPIYGEKNVGINKKKIMWDSKLLKLYESIMCLHRIDSLAVSFNILGISNNQSNILSMITWKLMAEYKSENL